MWQFTHTQPLSMRAVIRSAVPLSVVHTPGQRVVDAVGQFDGFVLGGEPLHGEDRGERLLLDDRIVLGHTADDRRLHVEATVAQPFAARLDLCVGRQRIELCPAPR